MPSEVVKALMVEGVKTMGRELAQRLPNNPELLMELNQLFHGDDQTPGRTYAGLIDYVFFERGLSLSEKANNPFVDAFSLTKQCTDEEKDVIYSAKVWGDNASEEINHDFDELIKSRAEFIGSGFQEALLSHQELRSWIKPLTKAEINERVLGGAAKYREQHPEEVRANILAASRKAVEQAGPIKYTPEVVEVINTLLEHGFNYEQIAWMMSVLGNEETKPGSINAFVNSNEKLSETRARIRAAEQDKKQHALTRIQELFNENPDPEYISQALQKEGIKYTPTSIKTYLSGLGLRQRVDWSVMVELNESNLPLNDIVKMVMVYGLASTREEYEYFNQILERARYSGNPISFSAFNSKKSAIKSESENETDN